MRVLRGLALSPLRAVRALLPNLALLLAAVLFSCVLGELYLRWFHPQPLEAACIWPDGTLRHLPSFSHVYTRQEFSNAVHYNAAGLRGPEIAPEKRPGVTRVLFLGDSFVEGKQVSDDEVLTAALQRLGGESGRPLEVINAGIAGTGTSEELLLWRRLGRTLHPDVVLLGFYPNDVRNNADRGLFDLREGRAVQVKEPPAPNVLWIYKLRKFLNSRSHLYILARTGLRSIGREDPIERRRQRADREEEAGGAAGGSEEAVPDFAGDPLEAEEVFERAPSKKVAKGWSLTLSLLGVLKDEVEADGARFAVVVFPTRFQVDDARWRTQASRLGVEAEAFDMRLPQEKLAAWSRDSGATVLDLLPAFRSRNRSNSFYFWIDAHWNRDGHALAAQEIFHALFSGRPPQFGKP